MLYLFNLDAFLKTFTSVTDEKRPLIVKKKWFENSPIGN